VKKAAFVTVFLLTCSALSAKEKVLYSFKGGQIDGSEPWAGVVIDKSGYLWGVTAGGTAITGASSYGTIYKLSSSGGSDQVEYSFQGCPVTGCPGDGSTPYVVTLVQDSSATYYGTTAYGGDYSRGTVWKFSGGVETKLFSFPDYNASNANSGGAVPFSGVILDGAGNLYGTTEVGGQYGYGVVYKLSPSGIETVLHEFSGPDGAEPLAALLMDSAGNLYGTTTTGGGYSAGVAFEITASGSYQVLHNFGPVYSGDGLNPYAGSLIMDSSGNIFGTAIGGGKYNLGAIFKISAAGVESIVYSFTRTKGDGSNPYSGLVFDSKGNMYGTTIGGGDPTCGCGMVYKVSPSGVETILHDFTGYPNDGFQPYSGALIIDSKSGKTLYGTTLGGGAYNNGTVYSLSAP
jgi:uncharacterized repeat protein (TIGR03803 family)